MKKYNICEKCALFTMLKRPDDNEYSKMCIIKELKYRVEQKGKTMEQELKDVCPYYMEKIILEQGDLNEN